MVAFTVVKAVVSQYGRPFESFQMSTFEKLISCVCRGVAQSTSLLHLNPAAHLRVILPISRVWYFGAERAAIPSHDATKSGSPYLQYFR